MRRYAETTSVEVAKSQGEIIGLVTKRGAKDFASGQYTDHLGNGRAFVAFMYRGFPVKLTCPAVSPKHSDPDQERRRQWRVMLLWVKAQLEAIDNGLLEPYAVFMPFLQLTDGRTVGEAAAEDGIHKVMAKQLNLNPPAFVPALEAPKEK